jgi:hypothetical protein
MVYLSNSLYEYINILEATKNARNQNNPVFIRFTNIRSNNCKKMDTEICNSERVL